MELRLDDSQVELQDAVRRFCTARFALDRVVEREGRRLDRVSWKELGTLGVLGVLAPEDQGGSGLGVLEAAIALEQLGAHLVPGPLLWSVLMSPLVEGVPTGDRVVGGLDGFPSSDSATDPLLVVEHAGDLDALVLLRPDGVFLCDGGDLPAFGAAAPLDPLTPVGRLDRADLPSGRQIGGPDDAARLHLVGTVLSAALLVGVGASSLDVARSYALEREQFGAAIGSFQAVKHILADVYVRTALARSATYAAAAVLDGRGDDDPGRAAAAAKLLAGEAAVDNAGAAVQVLGGMGFTWDMVPHHLLKRAWVLELAFGTVDDHALALGSAVGGDGSDEAT